MSRVAGAFFAGNTESVVELERRERSDRSVKLEEKIIGGLEGSVFGYPLWLFPLETLYYQLTR